MSLGQRVLQKAQTLAALGLTGLIGAAGLMLWTGSAWAQDERNRAAGIMFAGAMLMVLFVIFAVFYVYIAICLQTIAKKTNTPDAWMAWVPIANIILMLNIAHKPLWWIVLMLIPLVNVVVSILVWMEVAKARGKPEWWGILMIVPVANLIAPAYLAFSD